MTINVALGSGGKAQLFAQTMAIGDIEKQFVAAGQTNLVNDRGLYNTAAELTRIMGHKNPDAFFNDPTALNPQTGQLLNPPPAPPQPPPDPKLLAAQLDQASAMHKAQHAAIHLQVKTQGEIELARIKAALDAKMSVLEAYLKAAIEAGKCNVRIRWARGRRETAIITCRTPGELANIYR